MKRDWILSTGFLILLVSLIAGTVLLPAGAETITGSTHFDPQRFDATYGFGVSVVEGTIRFPSGKGPTMKDINRSTILLEGTLPPSSTYLIPGGLVCRYDALIVEYIIMAKINHIGIITTKKVWLTTTGSLNQTAGGTLFSAPGDIKIIIPRNPLPP